MKHAYLILAHNQFEVLRCLIKALDDKRNDIYIHFDAKLMEIPRIKTLFAGLHIINHRIDVRWGDVSMVEAEYALFEAAKKNASYTYYHLLSGVDLPLQSQDAIHLFFDQYRGKEFVGYSQYDYKNEINRKVNRYHLFPKYFRSIGNFSDIFRRISRAFFLRWQLLVGWRRNSTIEFKKGTQWVSITDSLIRYVLDEKEDVLRMYKNTFCSDEIFLQTLCWNSPFREYIFDGSDEANGSKRIIGWNGGQLIDWTNADYDRLMRSGALFARKFNSDNMDVVQRILFKILEKE